MPESGSICERLLLALSWDTVARGQGGKRPLTVSVFELFVLYTMCVLCNTTNKSFLEKFFKKQDLETKFLCFCIGPECLRSTLRRPCGPSYRPCGRGHPCTEIEESTGILAAKEPHWRETSLSFWAFGLATYGFLSRISDLEPLRLWI